MRSSRKRVNRAWLNDHLTDPYVRQAQREGYRSRAAYKLIEIDQEHRLIAPGQVVVDLGAAPGAWSQYLRRKMAAPTSAPQGLDGKIVALDVLDMEPVDGVCILKGDFREDVVLRALQEQLRGQAVDVVVCDMAPNLSGIAPADAARVSHLVELAVSFSLKHLRRPNGALLCKLFHGSGYSQLIKLFKDSFRTVKPIKPKASRDRSAETFVLGIGPKREPPDIDGCA